MNPDLRQAIAELRQALIESDNAGHFLRQKAFYRWTLESVFPQAVLRWIAEIGDRPCNRP